MPTTACSLAARLHRGVWLACVTLSAACSMHATEPPEQAAFNRQWQALLEERGAAAEARNELKLRDVNRRIDAFFAKKPVVRGWIAELRSVEKTLLSGTVATAERGGIEYHLGVADDDARLLAVLTALNKSDTIVFSGHYEGETTWTSFHPVGTPRVSIRLSDIARAK
jgi:hypothetical protein